MEADYWKARWRDARTGWHESNGSAVLRAHIARLGLSAGKRVLAPLAGKSHDLSILRETGAEVVGVELVQSAAAAFFEEHALTPVRAVAHGRPMLSADGISIVVGDFFEETTTTLGVFDAAYDRAALVALPPALRARYAKTLRALVRSGAPILVVRFEHDVSDGAPPFSVEPGELAALYPDASSIEPLETRDVTSTSAGLTERGATFVRECASVVSVP